MLAVVHLLIFVLAPLKDEKGRKGVLNFKNRVIDFKPGVCVLHFIIMVSICDPR